MVTRLVEQKGVDLLLPALGRARAAARCSWPCSATATQALADALAAAAGAPARARRVPPGLRRGPRPPPVRRRRPPAHAEPLRAVRPRADAGHALRHAAGRHRRRRAARHGRSTSTTARRAGTGRRRRRRRPRWRVLDALHRGGAGLRRAGAPRRRCSAGAWPPTGRGRRPAPTAHRPRTERARSTTRGVTIDERRATCAGSEPKVLVMVLAGGEGKRLAPLTADRAKPAVPFGGSYRIIDFVLSNFANAALPEDRRAHAVQEPQPRPPHHARRGGSRRCSATT